MLSGGFVDPTLLIRALPSMRPTNRARCAKLLSGELRALRVDGAILPSCGGRVAGRESNPKGIEMSATVCAEPSAKLLDVQAVAELLGCSVRSVYRLSDAGRMPPSIKLGSLVRWLGRRDRPMGARWLPAGSMVNTRTP